MENIFEKILLSLKHITKTAAIISLPIWLVTIFWAPHYVPGANGFADQAGNFWILYQGDLFLITTIIMIVGVIFDCFYIIPAAMYGVPVVLGGKVVQKTWEGGTKVYFPLTSVILLPTALQEGTATEMNIESLDGYDNHVEGRYQYKLNTNAHKLVKRLLQQKEGYSIVSINKILEAYMKAIVKNTYEGINNYSFLHSPAEKAAKIEIVKREFMEMVEKNVGIEGFEMVEVFACAYVFDALFLAKMKAVDVAEQEAKAALINAENAKAVQKLQAEALLFSMKMQADGKQYGGMREAEVQKQMGQVLKEYNELIFQEAMKNLPDCLSLGNSGVDMATIAAGMWSAYRKATSTTPPIVPPFTGPSGSLPKP